MTLITDAQATAARLLPPLGDRWLHGQAVGAQAAAIAKAVPPQDRELLVASAWLHDIGYATDLIQTGCHPIDGARYLEGEGFPPRLVALVAHHSCSRIEIGIRGLTTELRWPQEDSPVADALAYADMTTGPQGQRLTFSERIAEILTRYPAGSEVYQHNVAAKPLLAGHVARVEDRMGAEDQ
ncbi:HD domain-containing protein [Actinopolymorpha sp. B11F2]|uniref:HD domain-containing protein n=1 Tax=Actinopolymorpha sp. B11F2 TaxID=3160862 RepID=UPI0032E42BAE